MPEIYSLLREIARPIEGNRIIIGIDKPKVNPCNKFHMGNT